MSEDTCWKNEYYANDKTSIYFATGMYLRLTSNSFTSNKTGTTLYISNWTNVTLQDNIFTENTDYDYETACTGTWATMKKYVDSYRIQSYT